MRIRLVISVITLVLLSCSIGASDNTDGASFSNEHQAVDVKVLRDEYSTERDIIFHETPLFTPSDTLGFGRILVPGRSYSIRDGREMLVLYENGEIIQQFTDIDGYSSLFLHTNSFQFLDMNSDGYKEMLVYIEGVEMLPRLMIYLNNGSRLIFQETLQANKYELRDNHLFIESSIYDSWGAMFNSEYPASPDIVKYLPIQRYNFLQLTPTGLVNVNHLHPSFFQSCLNDYKSAFKALRTLLNNEDYESYRNEIQVDIGYCQMLIDECNQVIRTANSQ